jgi:thymidylate synthase (FAD)
MEKKIGLYSDGVGFVEYVSHMGSDVTVVNSARVSFGKRVSSLSDADKRLISYLIKHKHTSTFEHNVVTFRFKVPLFIRSQHHRHRTWSYNEISRRYTDFNLEFYEPKQFRKQSESNRQASIDEWFDPEYEIVDHPMRASDLLKQHHDASLYVYNKLLELGVCREQARGVLPQNMYTEYYGTANLNNIMKFIKLRLHDGAQWEIQRVATAVLEISEILWPNAVAAFRQIEDI